MMDMLELHKLLHKQSKIVQRPEPLISQNACFSDLKTFKTDTPITPVQVDKSDKPVPWVKWILIGGLVVAVVYLLYKYPKNENYQSIFERNRQKAKTV